MYDVELTTLQHRKIRSVSSVRFDDHVNQENCVEPPATMVWFSFCCSSDFPFLQIARVWDRTTEKIHLFNMNLNPLDRWVGVGLPIL